MKRLVGNSILVMLGLITFGCGGVKEVPPVTEPGAAASDAEMKARMDESMKKSGRQP